MIGNGAPKLKRSIIEPKASKKPAKPKKSPKKTAKTAKPKKPRATKKPAENPDPIQEEPDDEEAETEEIEKKKSRKKAPATAKPKKPRASKKQKEDLEPVEEEMEAPESHGEEEEVTDTQKAADKPKVKDKKKEKEAHKLEDSLHDELKQINHEDLDDSDHDDEPMTVTNGGQMRILELDADGNFPRLPKYAFQMLESVFGHKSFKPHQEDAIVKIACGLSTLVILSTGHGKSLIYQMAAKMYAKKYPGSVVLVISPLISLMQDQLANLSKGLKAAMCDSQMTYTEFQKMLEDLNDGKINILYMSPEALISKKIRSIPRLAFVCIDEVSSTSQLFPRDQFVHQSSFPRFIACPNGRTTLDLLTSSFAK